MGVDKGLEEGLNAAGARSSEKLYSSVPLSDAGSTTRRGSVNATSRSTTDLRGQRSQRLSIDGSRNGGRQTSPDSSGRNSRHNKPRERWAVRCTRAAVDNKFVVAITTLLTVWVLLSEDLKQIYTDKPADFWFGIAGLICISIFTLEIIFSSVGKEDYFLGFFFVLDVVSTATLILDLPWFNDMIMTSDEEDSGVQENGAKGRTARIGARSARVVRVIRLVRIAKLYKAFYEMSGRGRILQYKGKLSEDDDEEGGSRNSESRVGKKLSDITTRRVIILVLSMLMIMPVLQVEESMKLPTSASYGADEVWVAFKTFVRDSSGNATSLAASAARLTYETALLRFIFFHNWFAGNSGYGCSDGRACRAEQFSSHLFWVGFTGVRENYTEIEVEAMVSKARIRRETVDSWVQGLREEDAIYVMGLMPEAALDALWSPWYDCTAGDPKYQKWGFSLLQEGFEGVEYAAPCHNQLRQNERDMVVPLSSSMQEHAKFRFTFWFDERPFRQTEAWYGIVTTGFICVVLCMSAMSFYNDVNQLVLYPVEEMISKVMMIRDDPLMAVKMSEQMFAKEVKRFVSKSGRDSTDDPKMTQTTRARIKELMTKANRILACASTQNSEPMETVILEKTIVKLGSLLALGFGEAGAAIIQQNMSGSSSGVNVMMPGRHVDCVIGHIRISQFSTVTEVLQSKVMTFVNQVAEIVHGVVEEHLGSANKNNGDTFLLIWRADTARGRGASMLADLSLLAGAKIIGAVHRSKILADYRGHPGLQNKLGSKYRVHLTCGLHCGWAIEGAVGSEYKIEASYLSPNVSVAKEIEESATSIYGVCFLASEAVVRLASDEMRRKCRLIDCVVIPGSSRPLEMYSMDLDWTALPVDETPPMASNFGAKLRMRARQFLEAEKAVKPTQNVRALFDNDRVILSMRRTITVDFLEVFRMGYQNYAQGEWQVARRFLEDACAMRSATISGPGDGPCKALLHFMENPHQFEAPEGWDGIHDLHGGFQPRLAQGRGQNFKMSV